jgi:oligoribonuclease NrnB/cAMP/cGMP phosphodiesterase (DHH superfamily)
MSSTYPIVNQSDFWTGGARVDYVVSHKDCADGALASWIVKTYGGKSFERSQYLFIKAGATFEEQPVEDKTIMFLDNMPQNIEEIVQKAHCVIVLDHHAHPNYEIFLKLLGRYPDTIKGLVHQYGEKCASDIAWDFYQGIKPKPIFVNIVATNDLWKWETAPPEYKAIWRYFFQGKTDIDFDQLLLKEDYSQEIKLGKAMLEEDEKIIQEHMKRAQLRKVWVKQHTWKVYLVEGCPYAFISVLGARLAEKEECDFVAISNQEEKEYSVSLRSYKNKANVGQIAVELARYPIYVTKGGGHPNAAGIRLKCDPKLLFEILNPTEEERAQELSAWKAYLDIILYTPPADADELTIYDKYGNQRSPTSVGCNNKFSWDIGTDRLDADVDPNSDNFIYDKQGNRVTTAQAMKAVNNGDSRIPLHGNRIKPAVMDVSSPKQLE